MAVEKELSAPQLAGFVDRFLPEQQVHNFRPKPETEIQRPEMRACNRYNDAYGAYHYRPSFYSPPGYTQCVYPNGVQYTPFPEIQRFSRPDNASYAYPYGVPCPSQEVEIRQVDKVLPVQQLPSDFSRQPETDAKAGTTQHPPCKKSKSAPQNVRHKTADRTSRHKKQRSTSTPRSTSTEDRRRDRKKSAAKEDEPYPPSDASMDSSSEEEVVSPKHMMKPPKFDGQCSFETFMVQFSNCADYNKWTEAQKLAHLRNSLEKDAPTYCGTMERKLPIPGKVLRKYWRPDSEARLRQRNTDLNSGIGDVQPMKHYRAYIATSGDWLHWHILVCHRKYVIQSLVTTS